MRQPSPTPTPLSERSLVPLEPAQADHRCPSVAPVHRLRHPPAYQATRKFIWRKELQPIAVGMKRQAEMAWLSDLPAHAVLDTVARLISERKAGPSRRRSSSARGQATEITDAAASVPKLISGGDLPEGRLLASRIWRSRRSSSVPVPSRCPLRASRLGLTSACPRSSPSSTERSLKKSRLPGICARRWRRAHQGAAEERISPQAGAGAASRGDPS